MAEPVTDPIRYMDLGEFREAGYLQEVNRLFFHPLGLALEVVTEQDGTTRLGGVWDYRDDPEGIVYQPASLIDPDKIARVDAERERHAQPRTALLGSVIQQPGAEVQAQR